MRQLRLSVFCFICVLLLTGTIRAQEEDAPQKTQVKTAEKPKQGELHGRVSFSDGSERKGIIYLMGRAPLQLFDADKDAFEKTPLEYIESIKTVVVNEEMVDEWIWKEESKDEKIYTGKKFPKRRYKTEIKLRNGTTIRGDCVTVGYIKNPDNAEETKFFLKRYDKGSIEQTLSDIVYVKEIVFDKTTQQNSPCAICGVISQVGAVTSVKAIQHKHDTMFEADVERKSGKYKLDRLLPGFYDIIIETDKKIFLYTGLKGEEIKENKLSEQDKREIAERVNEIKSFYEKKHVLLVQGTQNRAKTLIIMRRNSTTTLEEEKGKDYVFVRIELWIMRKIDDGWLIDNGVSISRNKYEAEHNKEKEIVLIKELANKELNDSRSVLQFDFNVKEGK
ncbi:MAG: hypothetical protein ABIH42_10060 [Planctomycetota bacterium]